MALIQAPALAAYCEKLKPQQLETYKPDGAMPIWRVASVRFGADAWDMRERCFRFSPIRRADQSVVPVIYAASSAHGALAETVLRAPPVGQRAELRTSALTDRQLVQAKVLGVRSVLCLHGARAHRVFGEELIAALSCSLDYPTTSAWAQWLFDVCPNCDGLQWRSRQDDSAINLLLWQRDVDRIQLEVDSKLTVLLASARGQALVSYLANQWHVLVNHDSDSD